ncbi:MAG TPA: type II secretion system secretin GspD [Geobacteraceae bacterium]|nr:type II secretion system secretin GspD [Geobacteraceae bacterium]
MHFITMLSLLFLLLAPLPALAKGVVLNFSDVDISTMVKFISDLTGKNFVLDDRVKGKISVYSPTKLTPDEAFNVFTSVLELKGFTLTRIGKVYKIIPTSAAKQSGMKILSDGERGPVNETYVARVIELDHIAAQEAVTFLQPVISKDGYISSFGPANMVLVVDSSLNIQKLLGIIELIDTDQRRDKAELVFLKNAGAENVAKVIQEWLKSRDKSGKPAGQGAGGGIIVPDARLNALIVFGSDKDKEDVKNLVAMLDVVPPSTSSKVNVYYLENADATDVAKVLDGVVKGSAAAAATPGAAGAAAAAPQQSPFEGGKITITPDKATNSLVIMASPNDYQNLVQVLQKLDKRRRQVFVQAVIAEITPDKLKDIGVQLGITGGGVTGNTAAAGAFDPFNFIGSADPAQAAIFTVLKGLATNTNVQLAGNLKALFTDKAVNVLSTPSILTSDNKEAEIFVGQNVPFITSTSVVTGGIAQQSVTRQDVGIKLKITPQISEGEYVKLDINQEISAVTGDKGQATDIVTTTRSAKTSVVVKDKETVVIGGLIQDQDQEIVTKVPLLGDIPFLGWLFKTKHKERTKTNLIIVLTPRIIRGAQEMAEVTETQKQKFGEAVRMDQPFSLDKELQLKP